MINLFEFVVGCNSGFDFLPVRRNIDPEMLSTKCEHCSVEMGWKKSGFFLLSHWEKKKLSCMASKGKTIYLFMIQNFLDGKQVKGQFSKGSALFIWLSNFSLHFMLSVSFFFLFYSSTPYTWMRLYDLMAPRFLHMPDIFSRRHTVTLVFTLNVPASCPIYELSKR